MQNRLSKSRWKIAIILSTITHLRWLQIWGRGAYLLKRNIFHWLIKYRSQRHQVKEVASISELIPKRPVNNNVNIEKNQFIFLNKKCVYQNDILWNDAAQERLWLYNLHYFDYLLIGNEDISIESFNDRKRIISDWIKNNPTGLGAGWEPYPTSLRVVNWIFHYNRFLDYFKGNQEFNNYFLESLLQQVHYLTYFIEYHILVNHIFKNGKALYIAGIFFKNDNFLKIGREILYKEIRQQIFPDGGHFERSPMYHNLILEDVLDLINFIRNDPLCTDRYLGVQFLRQVAKKMLNWAEITVQPDGKIPLLGDSALDGARDIAELKLYAQELNINIIQNNIKQPMSILRDSGYCVFRTNEQFLIFDFGELGVKYQPGHAHCDLLSFEFSLQNKRIIVDSGIGNYLPSELRQKARGIKAHNTVMVNKLDQAEIWSAFRMGKRVNNPKFEHYREANSVTIFAEYKNNLNFKYNYTHSRSIKLIDEKFFVLTDQVRASHLTDLQIFFHISPDCKFNIGLSQIEIQCNGELVIMYFDSEFTAEEEGWFYSRSFGSVEKSSLLIIRPKKEKETKLTYIISPFRYVPQANEFIFQEW
jgi:hypothetical protein